MKKIFFLMTLIMGLVFSASAQNVEVSRPFNNTYISIDGGIVSPMVQPGFTEFFTTSMQTFGFEFGKRHGTMGTGQRVRDAEAIGRRPDAVAFHAGNERFFFHNGTKLRKLSVSFAHHFW